MATSASRAVNFFETLGNFPNPLTSKPMSSLSGAQYEADLPLETVAQSRDGEWLRQAQNGDRAAYGQIVVAYQDRLYNAVLRLVGDGDEAAELTQEAFTRGLMKIDSFRGEASAYTWLFRIAMNLAISELRKNKRHRVFSLDPIRGALHDGRESRLPRPGRTRTHNSRR